METITSPMQALFAYVQRAKGLFYFACSSSVLNKVLDLMPPLLVGWIIDSVSGAPPGWMSYFVSGNRPMDMAVFLTVLGVLIFALESLFEWMYQYGFMTLAQNLQHTLRMDTYAHIQDREMRFFENQRLGETMAIMNDDVNQLERFLNTGFNDILQLIVLFVFSAVVLFATSWQLSLVGLLPIPLILWGSSVYQKIIAPRYDEVRQSVGRLSSRLENNLSGISVIKSFTAEDFEYARVEAESDAYRQANLKAIRISAAYIPIIRMAIALGFGGVLLLGSYWVLQNNGMLSVGELVLFSMLIQRILWPMTRLGQTFDAYERTRSSAARIFGLLKSQSQIQSPEAPQRLQPAKGQITFDQVTFQYESSPMILKGLDFQIAAGEMVGFAGATGAGKSTLIKLLLRLYDPSGGEIRLDGVPLPALELKNLRQNIALVSQDVYLFHGSIRENICYAMPEVSDEQLIQAAQQAQFHDFVLTLPEGYNTLIGERGIKLSGGQRQRLSIARALLKGAPILILDEATSAVDTETERAIQENLESLTHNKTALVIAHRLSTLRNAHRIMVLKDGKLSESGTHTDLLAQGGTYADLWKIQIGEV